jgi:hypothetical protein
MREFTFSIEYGDGADPVMDVFIDHPTLAAESLHGGITEDEFWRVERMTGPTAALDAVERLRLDETVRTESITDRQCRATRYHDVLQRGDGERVIYGYVGDISGCEAVQTLAGRYLPSGTLLCTKRQGARREWRVLMRSEEKIGLLYDALGANLRSDLSFRMGHLQEADGWRHDALGAVSLPPKQRAALRAAVDHGYYRTPREITLDDLAAKLDVPRSTLSYRLRRAEQKLVTGYLVNPDC